jgi:hypothetical protein
LYLIACLIAWIFNRNRKRFLIIIVILVLILGILELPLWTNYCGEKESFFDYSLFNSLGIFECGTAVTNSTSPEETCLNAGGTVKTQLCCNSVGDFPYDFTNDESKYNTCFNITCNCTPENFHEIKICDCGEGKCLGFNEKRYIDCIANPNH